MAEAGTQMSPVATPTPVTITNGIPSPNPASMLNQGQLQFTNNDASAYPLEFWTKGNDKHAAVSVVIGGNGGTVLVQGNASTNDQNTTCNYNVLTLSGSPTDPADGGTKSIIIGSGNPDEDSQN